MLLFPMERLVFLATPKCGSTSVHQAYAPYAAVVLGGHPRLKHLRFKRYEHGIAPLVGSEIGSLETVCIIRDPVAHIRSSYRYHRGRDRHVRPGSHHDRTYEDFVEAFLDPDSDVRIRTQHSFVEDDAADVGVNRIFALEHIERFVCFMNERLRVRVSLPVMNTSSGESPALSSELEERLRERLAPDLALYEAVLKAEDGWKNPDRKFEAQTTPKKAITAMASVDQYLQRAKRVRKSGITLWKLKRGLQRMVGDRP
jgi:hypothetical protein